MTSQTLIRLKMFYAGGKNEDSPVSHECA